MAISSNKYVAITSGVGGAAATRARELLNRIFTINELVPTGSVLKFSDLDSVLDYFGSTSEEYKRASFYFGFVSKAIRSPQNISFARWADADTSAQVFGAESGTLTELQAITAGAITVTLAGIDGPVVVDFSAAASYADVATELQTKIQTVGGTFAATTVAYNALKTQFNLDTNGVADGVISITGLPSVIGPIGWDSTATFSNGIAEQTVTDVLSSSSDLTNDFGSYLFIPTLTLVQVEESAAWNITRNNEFQYHVQVLLADTQAYFDNLNGYGGTGVTLYDPANVDEYPEMLPCALLASQDFSKAGAAANYMYTQDSRLTATVDTTAESNALDAQRINYYGKTQEAGSEISFYQRGTLMGGATSPLKMGVYANEQWLKSDLKAGFFNMQLALQIVGADDTGKATGLAYIVETVNRAITNGSIAQGKVLTTTQIQFINQVSGRDDAHYDVSSKGYWFAIDISEEVNGGVTEYFLDYTLIYAKRDAIDKVVGRHILI